MKKYLPDTIILALIYLVYFSFIDTSYVFQNTHISGGDTISHPYIAHSLKMLWGSGQFWGWNDGWSGGIPFLYFYFYPIYVVSLSFELLGAPPAIAFKLMVLFLYALLPCIYYLTGRRWLSTPLATLFCSIGIFLFLNELDSRSGGNFKSFLAGQMSHHFGLLMLVGYFSYLIKRELYTLGACFFLSMSVLSHVYSALFATLFTLLYFIDLYWTHRNLKVFIKLSSSVFFSFFITSFFWAPFLFYRNYTVAPINYTQVDWLEIFRVLQLANPMFLGLYLSSIILSLFNIFYKKCSDRVIISSFLLLLVITVLSLKTLDGTPILHIRIPPEIYLTTTFLMFINLKNLNISKATLYFISAVFSFLYLQTYISSPFLDKVLPKLTRSPLSDTPHWWKWNMSGIEVKNNYKSIQEVWSFLKKHPDQEGRVVVEYQDYNKFGSPRIFELTPMMTGKSIMEGLLLESSPNYPAYYYTNFFVNRKTWWPGFPLKKVPTPNMEKALKYYELFNVKFYVAYSNSTKKKLRKVLKPSFKNKDFSVFEINPQSTLTASVKGQVPQRFSAKPLLDSILNYPKSLDSIVIQKQGKTTKDFPSNLSQKLEPLKGHWENNKQSYLVTETNATPENPQNILFKISYFPNWKADSGEEVKLVSPNLMMVQTTKKQLRISFRPGIIEKITLVLSIFSFFVLLLTYGRKLLHSPFGHR